MLFPAHHSGTHRYLHPACLRCASLFRCLQSAVWGWLVHDTLLKIDIHPLCKMRLTKEWEGMKAHKGARECDSDREKQKNKERRKEDKQKETKSCPCTKLVLKGNKHIHPRKFEMEEKLIFQVRGMSQFFFLQESKWGCAQSNDIAHRIMKETFSNGKHRISVQYFSSLHMGEKNRKMSIFRSTVCKCCIPSSVISSNFPCPSFLCRFLPFFASSLPSSLPSFLPSFHPVFSFCRPLCCHYIFQ